MAGRRVEAAPSGLGDGGGWYVKPLSGSNAAHAACPTLFHASRLYGSVKRAAAAAASFMMLNYTRAPSSFDYSRQCFSQTGLAADSCRKNAGHDSATEQLQYNPRRA